MKVPTYKIWVFVYHRAILETGSWGLVDSGNGSLGDFEAWGFWGFHGLLDMGFGNCLLLAKGMSGIFTTSTRKGDRWSALCRR